MLARLALATASGLAAVALASNGPLLLTATNGTSMNPTYIQGDLVVVAEQETYAVGDIAAFPKPNDEKTLVLHRIIGGDAETGFVFKGDNNQSIDPVTPTADELVGTAVLHVPRGGIWLKRLTAPPMLAAYAFLLIVGGTAARTRRERKKERRTMSPRHRAAPCKATAGLPPALRPVAAGAAVVGLTGLALSGLAYTRPATTAVEASSTVASTMDFGYTAQVPQSPAYDGTTVAAPQPVFRALTDDVDVTYRYAGPPGTLSVAAELSASSGWKGTVPLVPAQPVGEEHEGSVALDLTGLQDRAEQAGEVIGIPASSLTVAVVPTVELTGGGTFAPRLELALDRTTLKPTGELTAKDETATTGTREAPAQLSALGRSLDVATARAAGPLLGLAAVLAGMVLAALARLAGPVSEADRVRHRYGDLVMTVMPMVLTAGRPVVDVPDVDTLVKLAERYGLPVLTWSRGGVDTYVVQDEGSTFRYRKGGAPEPTELPVQRQPHETTVLPG